MSTWGDQQFYFGQVVDRESLAAALEGLRTKSGAVARTAPAGASAAATAAFEAAVPLFKILFRGWYRLAIKYCSQTSKNSQPDDKDTQKGGRKHTPATVINLMNKALADLRSQNEAVASMFYNAVQEVKMGIDDDVRRGHLFLERKKMPPSVGTLGVSFHRDIKELLAFTAKIAAHESPSAEEFISMLRVPLTRNMPRFLQYLEKALEKVKELYREWLDDLGKTFRGLNNPLNQLALQLATECRNKILQGIRVLCHKLFLKQDWKVPTKVLDEVMKHITSEKAQPHADGQVTEALKILGEVEYLPKLKLGTPSDGWMVKFYLALFRHLNALDSKFHESFLLLPQTTLSKAPIVLLTDDVLRKLFFSDFLDDLKSSISRENKEAIQHIIKMVGDKSSKSAIDFFVELFSCIDPLRALLKVHREEEDQFELVALRSNGYELQFLLQKKGKGKRKRQPFQGMKAKPKAKRGPRVKLQQSKRLEPESQLKRYEPRRMVSLDPGVRAIFTACDCTLFV